MAGPAAPAAGAGGTGGGAGGTTSGNFITFSDRLLGAANRSATTDFTAPALDVPTFRRTFVGDGGDNNVFQFGGTSASSAIVSGSYALVSSALDYWSTISKTGVTDSAYLTTPVAAHVLNYGPHQLFDPRAYNNPSGINAILAYTAVPAADINDNLTVAGPPLLLGTTLPRSFARIDVGNAIAAVEGKIALNYLIQHHTFNIIDANHDGLITAQELQNFVDAAPTTGQADAGAMARLLGGTARAALNTSFTGTSEQPDQPDVLQRRFNFFDYTVHGHLQGSVSIAQFKLLNKYILPTPTAYTITDRQRASANGFLIAPQAQRNFKDLRHLLPKYEFVPAGAVKPYRGVSPAQFGVNTNEKPSESISPVYTLFDGGARARRVTTSAPPAQATAPAAAAPTTPATVAPTSAPSVATTSAAMTPTQASSASSANPVAVTAPATTATTTATATPSAAIASTTMANVTTAGSTTPTAVASSASSRNTTSTSLAATLASIVNSQTAAAPAVLTTPAVPIPPAATSTRKTTIS